MKMGGSLARRRVREERTERGTKAGRMEAKGWRETVVQEEGSESWQGEREYMYGAEGLAAINVSSLFKRRLAAIKSLSQFELEWQEDHKLERMERE